MLKSIRNCLNHAFESLNIVAHLTAENIAGMFDAHWSVPSLSHIAGTGFDPAIFSSLPGTVL